MLWKGYEGYKAYRNIMTLSCADGSSITLAPSSASSAGVAALEQSGTWQQLGHTHAPVSISTGAS